MKTDILNRCSTLAWLLLLTLAACGGGGDGNPGNGTGVVPVQRTAQNVYFVARDPNLQQEHIYSASDEDGTWTQLTPNSTVANAVVRRMALSPDRQTIAYAAYHDTDSVIDFYLLPTSGGMPVKVTTAMPDDGGISEIAWSPDSSQVAYVANTRGLSSRNFLINEVFMVDNDGGNHRKINGSLGTPPRVTLSQIQWSPDGRFLAQMVATLEPFFGRIGINIYDTTLGQPNSVRITQSVDIGNDETLGRDYAWHPDSTKLAYLSQHDTGVDELFVANAVGQFGVEKLNGSLPSGGWVTEFSWSPSGDHIHYITRHADLLLSGHYLSDEDGGSNRRLDTVAAGTLRRYESASWAPHDDRIVFTASPNVADMPEIFVVNPDGSQAQITPPLVAGQFAANPMWSPDGTRIAFLSNIDAAGNNGLFVADAAGAGEPVQVSGGTTWRSSFGTLAWTPDSTRIAYVMTQDDQTVHSLYIGDVRGQARTRVNDPLVSPEKLIANAVVLSADGTRVMFQTMDDKFRSIGLYVGFFDGAPPLNLHEMLVFSGKAAY